MKAWKTLTKTQALLVALAVCFLLGMALLYSRMTASAVGTEYTVTTQRRAEETVTPEPKGPVDINTAGLEELQTLRGVGPALAQRIIDYREENGPFRSVEELLEVRGIGEATLEKFRDHAAVASPDGERSAEEAESR